MGSHRDQYGRQLTTAKYFSELTTSQLRHLLLTRLPMSTGVDCWGADRATLLEMAAAHGLHELTYADREEIGPCPEADTSGKSAARDMEKRISRMRTRRQVDNRGFEWKLYAQMFIGIAVVLLQGGRWKVLLGIDVRPTCEEPRWYQWSKPGANGECTVRESPQVSKAPAALAAPGTSSWWSG